MTELLESISLKRSNGNYSTVWWMPGGGANWVNYMTWCYYHNKILPTVPLHFSLKIVKETFPEYDYLFWLQNHQSDPANADIVFGSCRNGLNLRINNIIKNGNSAYKPEELVNFNSPELDYNLDWALIVEDPEQFVKDVNRLGEYNIEFNSIVEQAFVQYLDSAYPDPLLHGDQYQTHPWIAQAFECIVQHLYLTDSSTSQKTDKAQAMIESQWVKYYPATWHG